MVMELIIFAPKSSIKDTSRGTSFMGRECCKRRRGDIEGSSGRIVHGAKESLSQRMEIAMKEIGLKGGSRVMGYINQKEIFMKGFIGKTKNRGGESITLVS